MKSSERKLYNYRNGRWEEPEALQWLEIRNPATQELLGKTPLSRAEEVHKTVESAVKAFPQWRQTPPLERVQYLFKLRDLLKKHFDMLAETITKECGKTLQESRGELQRGIENVEVACGIPTLMQGYNLEDIAPGIDEIVLRQPLGVVAAITPFNFPGMIPLWFLPYALACGNCFILKPSEKTPITATKIFELLHTLSLPDGVVNLVQGTKEAVDALLHHPEVKAISFVGSKPVADYIYAEAAKHGKRVQCQAGAKNHVVIMPDANIEMSTKIVSESAFGCAGQRCLAISVAITVGQASASFQEAITARARAIKTGYGLEPETQMGPLITPESKARVLELIEVGLKEGAQLACDGRSLKVERWAQGNFLGPTILKHVPPCGDLSKTEIFGPVLSLIEASSLEEAIEIINKNPYGNAASIFTSSGQAARKFRYEVTCGNVGINIGVPAPMAFFPFSGWKGSFLGVLHGQGKDAVEFYTEKKVVVERWLELWSRKF